MNDIFFEDVFEFKKAKENHSLKRMIEDGSNNHHQLEGDEIEPKMSKMSKITKTFGPYFLIYLLENELQTYSQVVSYLEACNQKETINIVESFMNNHTQKLVSLPPKSKLLGHKWIFKMKIKADRTIDNTKQDLQLKVSNNKNV